MDYSGVYQIVNKVNSKRYIGSSIRIKNRLREHKNALVKNIHPNRKLQNAWNKYGEEKFVFEQLEIVSNVDVILKREQYWIDKYKASDTGYNILSVAESPSGFKHSESTKLRMSLASKGKKKSQEHCQNIAIAKIGNEYGKGVVLSKEARKSISEKLKGNKNGCGHIVTEEHKAKLSECMKGNKHGVNSSRMKGKLHTEESKAKMSQAQKRRRLREKEGN